MTLNIRYQLAGNHTNDTKESSSRWLLLLSAELPQNIGLEYINICLNGSIELLDLLSEATTEMISREITTQGLPDAISTQGKEESPLAENFSTQQTLLMGLPD